MEALTGVRPRGAIYPGGEYAADTPARLSSLGIRYARTTRPTYGFGLPENFLLWHPTCHFYDERVEELIEKFAEEKEERVSLFHLYGHSYELDYGKGWQYIEALFRRLTAIERVRSMSYAEIYELFGTNKKGGGGCPLPSFLLRFIGKKRLRRRRRQIPLRDNVFRFLG